MVSKKFHVSSGVQFMHVFSRNSYLFKGENKAQKKLIFSVHENLVLRTKWGLLNNEVLSHVCTTHSCHSLHIL